MDAIFHILRLGLFASGFMLVGAFAPAVGNSDLREPGAPGVRQRDVVTDVRGRLKARLPEVSETIQVESRKGHVVLSGSVDILPQKEIAAETAESVRGVQGVSNNLTVLAAQRSRSDLTRDVAWALKSDPATFAYGIDVSAQDGVVTLSGTVDTVPQKRVAAWDASGIRGVHEINNQIQVNPEKRSDRDIHDDLVTHYAMSPIFNDDQIDVQVDDGVVALSGHVDSALEKNWAREEAWLRGVKRVNADLLGVRYTSSLSHAGRAPRLGDKDIRRAIVKAFVYDPRVASVNPEVAVTDGLVTLRGRRERRRWWIGCVRAIAPAGRGLFVRHLNRTMNPTL